MPENETSKDNPPSLHPIVGRGVTLTAAQLRDALYFANPDGENEVDQQDTEITIVWLPDQKSVEGVAMPAGYYCYYAEYPDEGVYGPLSAPNE